MQLGGGAGEAAFLRHGMEVTQVVEIEPFHRALMLLRIIRSVHSERRISPLPPPIAECRRERRAPSASGEAEADGKLKLKAENE